MTSDLGSDARNARALAILRIGVGILFLIFGEYKVFGTQFTLHGGFQFWINKFLTEGGAYPFMAPVLRNFVLPHSTPRRLPGSVRRTSHWPGSPPGSLRSPSQHRRPNLHAHPALLLRLPRPLRPALAILLRQP